MSHDWIREARRRYLAVNAETLRWMLDRSLLQGRWVDTKVNSITLRDYTSADGLRGPRYVYGWIQGRALEALATHASVYAKADPLLADRARITAHVLYDALAAVQARDGHVYFCYDEEMRPILPDGTPQTATPAIYTYADAFAAKGLVAAASAFDFPGLDQHLAYLDRVVAASAEGRFQMNEKRPLNAATLAEQPDDFGPRMILLGAGDMLNRMGLSEHAAFTTDFIDHILSHHLDQATGLIRDVPGGDACNIGHGIEFIGFALASLGQNAAPALAEKLERVLIAQFKAGFKGPGIVLSVSGATGDVIDGKCPWWSLPETIRAAALAYGHTGSAESLRLWQQADAAFFKYYWRPGTGLAYQTLTREGPLDFVPATPDLDPGYHTGLSLLGAVRVAERLGL